MARKLQLDVSIASGMKAAADDSFKDNIKMIDIEKVIPSEDNFYSLSDIELLADDIERQGLKHNLVVCENSDIPGTFVIKSGHRRFAAIKLLSENNRYNSRYVPCLIDGKKSKSENILDLIMLNATARVMSDSELFEQYESLRNTLEQLKSEGKKIGGRIRENIAAVLNISPAQVGKIENIKHNAVNEIQTAVENGEMSIAVADKAAKLSREDQKKLIRDNDLSSIKSSDIKNKKCDFVPSENEKKSEETESVLSDLDELKQNLFSCLSEFNSNISDSENIDDIRYYLTELYKKIENIMEEKNDGKNYT